MFLKKLTILKRAQPQKNYYSPSEKPIGLIIHTMKVTWPKKKFCIATNLSKSRISGQNPLSKILKFDCMVLELKSTFESFKNMKNYII